MFPKTKVSETQLISRGTWHWGCIPLRWSGSGLVILEHLDHSRSNEPMNPLDKDSSVHLIYHDPVISDHWSWPRIIWKERSGSPITKCWSSNPPPPPSERGGFSTKVVSCAFQSTYYVSHSETDIVLSSQHRYSTRFVAMLQNELHVFCCPFFRTFAVRTWKNPTCLRGHFAQ